MANKESLKRFCLFFFSLFFLLSFDRPSLKKKDIRPCMDEVMSYHVEHKELTPLIIKRSFKNCIDLFDRSKRYLLDQNTKPYLYLSNSLCKKVLKQLQRDQFTHYEELFDQIAASILSARKIRAEIERELIFFDNKEQTSKGESYLQFASDEKILGMRIKKDLLRFLNEEKKSSPYKEWTPKRREKVIALFERKLKRVEEPYLTQNQEREHHLSLCLLKSLAKSLDAHTLFFSPEEAEEMRSLLKKEFKGIGLYFKEGVDGIEVTDMVKGGPADRCGKIQKGDLLVEVNGQNINDIAYDQVLQLMQSKKKASLKFQKENLSSYQVTLTQEKVVMEHERIRCTSEAFGDGIIGKIALSSFYEGEKGSSYKDVKKAIKELEKQGDIKGLVLDLRHNTGGFLQQAVKVGGLFIKSGVVVISQYGKGEKRFLRDIDNSSSYQGPLLVLTSKLSASAAEIVAQALQDYGAALVVGDERSYGKGTVQFQNITDEKAKAYFTVTIGRYYTVSGRSTQIDGVKADIVIPTEYSCYNIGERFLDYPLKSDNIEPAFVDSLEDLDEQARYWFERNYLPHQQKKQTIFQEMLPTLKTNSEYRLKQDHNFIRFLEHLDEKRKEGESFSLSGKNNYGLEDLQQAESINILKDMIILDREATNF